MSVKVRDFIKQLTDLGCRSTNTKGADQTWRTPRGNAFFLKINRLGDDITVGTLGSVMRVLKKDGFYLEGSTLKATPEAYPEDFQIGERPESSNEPSYPKKHKEIQAKFTCVLCHQSIDDRPNSNKVKKHLESCGKGESSCRYCGKAIPSPLGLQKHETHCSKRKE